MKFFATVLALMAASARAVSPPLTPQQLLTRWDMDEPNITYVSDENKFILDFPNASTANTLTGLQEEFYDVNCKDDGSGFPEVVVSDLFSEPDSADLRPIFTKPASMGNKPQLAFVIDTQSAAANPYVYEVIGADDDTCMGQYYNLTLDINITTEFKVDANPTDITITVYQRDGGAMDNFTFQTTTEFDSAVDGEEMSILVTDMCRGVDYVFNYTDSGSDGLTDPDYGGAVSGYYHQSDETKNLIFTQPGDQIGAGFDALINLPLNPQNPATNIQGREGQGMVKFCVRSSLGYDGDVTQGWSLAAQIAAGFQEVNFIESLITIFYDLTAGFSVLDFNVDPKERVETTVAKDTYGLEAWLCYPTPTDNMETIPFADLTDVIDKVVPMEISDNYKASAPEADKEYFNQGALITVCVAPDDDAWKDGIRMNGLNTFKWKRDDLSQTASSLVNPADIEQVAIENGGPAGNQLTSYVSSNCVGGKTFCEFSSILFADFYISQGVVGGSGTANLIFAAPGTRRLGAPEEEGRQLQEEEAAESPFDVNVPVDLTDTGPAGLKTAAGVSFATSTLTLALALMGAALLA